MRKMPAIAGATLFLLLGLLLAALPARAGGPPAAPSGPGPAQPAGPAGPTAPATPTQPLLTGITAAHAASARADLLHFNFHPSAPTAVTARYVPASELVQDGSGLPVTLRGRSFVQVVFHNAVAHDERGRLTAPRTLFPVRTTTNVVQVRLGGDFEGVVTYFVGLRQPAPGPRVHPTVQHTGTGVTVAIPAG